VHTGGALLRVAVDDVVAEAETTGCGDAFAAGFLSVWANSPAAADGQLPPRNLAAPSGAGEPRDLAERAGADELGDLAAPSGADELRDPADRADPAAPTDPAAPLEPAAENHRALLDAVRTGHAWAAEIARRPGAQPALR
jgi:sugar/nucleoside kinase (ribokinase family)